MAETPKRETSRDSYHALGRLRHDDKDERQALEAACVRWIQAGETAKRLRALQYFENAAHLCGNHLIRFGWSQAGALLPFSFGRDDRSRHDAIIARTADNRLVRPTEKVVSMFCKGRPTPRITPNSDQPDDEDAAAIAGIVLDLLFEKPLNMPSLRRRAALTAAITGTVAIETEWGETDIPIEIPKTKVVKRRKSKLFEDQDAVETVPDGTDVVMRQDEMARVLSALHVTPDPGATNEDDMVWIRQTSFEDLDLLRDAYDRSEEGYYPDALSGVRSQTGTDCPLFWWTRIQDLIDSPQHYDQGAGMTPSAWNLEGGLAPNTVVVETIDVKPNRLFPRGRTLVMAGGRLIYCLDQARAWRQGYTWRWHGYAFWRWFELVGRFWGIPLLSLLVPLQKRINAIDALVQINRTYISLGQWLLPKHAKVAEGRISALPGEHYTYTDIPGHRGPERVKNEPLPQELLAERPQLIQSIEWIASTGVGDQQLAASAQRAGVMLEFIERQQNEGKMPTAQAYERMLETVGQNVLIDVQAALGTKVDPELTQRLLVAARDQGELAIKAFTGAALRDHHQVKIDIASEILQSPEARKANAETALQFAPAAAKELPPEWFQALMEALGLADFVKTPQNAAAKRARRILSWISQGNLEAAFLLPKIDEPTAMLPVFQMFMLSPRWLTWKPEQRKALQVLYDQCMQLVQQQMQQQMAQAAQMQALQQGAKGQKKEAA